MSKAYMEAVGDNTDRRTSYSIGIETTNMMKVAHQVIKTK